jgi:hypothetical protein
VTGLDPPIAAKARHRGWTTSGRRVSGSQDRQPADRPALNAKFPCPRINNGQIKCWLSLCFHSTNSARRRRNAKSQTNPTLSFFYSSPSAYRVTVAVCGCIAQNPWASARVWRPPPGPDRGTRTPCLKPPSPHPRASSNIQRSTCLHAQKPTIQETTGVGTQETSCGVIQ